MSKNKLKDNSLLLKAIPKYPSNIVVKRGSGLGGELTVPSNTLAFWNDTGRKLQIDGKNCIELGENNRYSFDKDNLLAYMESVHQEYISNALQSYKTYDQKSDMWKSIDADGWEYRYQRIKEKDFKLDFDLYMKITRDTDVSKKPRYYISSKGDNYKFIIEYCLIPKYTNIKIEKKSLPDGVSQYTFFLEAVGLDDTKRIFDDAYSKEVGKHQKKNMDELYKEASRKNRKGITKKVTTTKVYVRDPKVSAYVKKRAGGKCDLCKLEAPFTDSAGNPYLEEHHVVKLADGGSDSIDNTVALCPNCHRKVHVIGTKEMNEAMLKRIGEYAELEAKAHGGRTNA
jgi:5-methylcytosine-specific restriction protein A